MSVWLVLPALFGVALLFVVLPVALAVYAHYRRPRLLRCPNTGRDTAIVVDPLDAAAGALVGATSLRVRACTLWPALRDCGRQCLSLREASR